MGALSITDTQFDAIKDKIVRDYENFSLSDAHQQTRELAPDLFYNVKYTWKESLPVAKSVTHESLKNYSKALYKSTFLEAMVYGDFPKHVANDVVDLFVEKTKTTPIKKEEAFENTMAPIRMSTDNVLHGLYQI